MRNDWTRVLLFVALLSPVTPAGASGFKSLAVREGRVNLGAKPVSVTIGLRMHRTEALTIARDPKRHLMLRIEGIGVSAQPDVVYEIHVGSDVSGPPAGMLSFYGIQGDQNGKGIVEVDIGKAAERELRHHSVLRITFVARSAEPVAHPRGRAWFREMRITEE